MENAVNIEYMLCKKVEEILKKETALTPDDVNAVKELSSAIANLAQIRLLENRYALEGRSGRASQRLLKEN